MFLVPNDLRLVHPSATLVEGLYDMTGKIESMNRCGASTRFTYHPREIALAGYSGSGKTTLAGKLLRRWSDRHAVGFVKHDAHRFQMDKPGKDTHRAMEAGAASILINDPKHFARISSLRYSRFERSAAFVDADFVLVEGFKRSELPKLLVLDDAGRAIEEFHNGAFPNVLAFVGAGERPFGLPDLPFFHRDDVDGIASFIEAFLFEQTKSPLYGLVLVGGESRRMGRPKWALTLDGETQLERTVGLVRELVDQVFVSVRPGQSVDLPEGAEAVDDVFPFRGPINGILSAMEVDRDAAWLVVACDLPLLDPETLQALIEGRDPLRIATAYQSARDGLPEPLCAIWEPRSRQRLLQAISLDLRCPRKVLIESRPELLTLANRRALDNANTPEEYEQAVEALRIADRG